MVGCDRQQFRFGVGRMAKLATPLANFAVFGKDAIHCADRALVYAFIEQRRVDFRRRQIGKAGRPQQIEHVLPRPRRHCARRARARFRQASGLRPAPYAALQAGARDAECRTARRNGARRRQRGGERLGQAALLGPMSGGTGGSSSPSRSASFFWSSMIASARSRRRRSCAFSRLDAASLADSGICFGRFWSAFDRRQATQCSRLTLPAPLAQGRRIKPVAAQYGADFACPGCLVDFFEDAQFFSVR